MSPSKRTPGRRPSTKSSPRPAPNPLKVAHMVAECLEIAPRVTYPLEVKTGAHLVPEYDLPALPLAVIDLRNHEDGHEYTVMVMLKRSPTSSQSSGSE